MRGPKVGMEELPVITGKARNSEDSVQPKINKMTVQETHIHLLVTLHPTFTASTPSLEEHKRPFQGGVLVMS